MVRIDDITQLAPPFEFVVDGTGTGDHLCGTLRIYPVFSCGVTVAGVMRASVSCEGSFSAELEVNPCPC